MKKILLTALLGALILNPEAEAKRGGGRAGSARASSYHHHWSPASGGGGSGHACSQYSDPAQREQCQRRRDNGSGGLVLARLGGGYWVKRRWHS